MSSCLIDERPIALQPTLIRIFGFERATVLQQLHFHLQNQKSGKIIDGHKWVWNTYEEWSKNDFPFWEPRTVRKWFSKLEEEGLLVSAQFDKSDWDRRKYYRINYDAFNAKASASKRHDDDTSESHDDDTSRRPERDTSCIRTETSTEITTEREPLVSFVEAENTNQPFAPNDDFVLAPLPQWSVAERFILKACELWDELANQEKPVVETNWKTKQSVKVAGKFVEPRLDVGKRIGGTPKLFQEFWRDKLKRDVSPRPDYVVEQWEAYNRWLIENYETHRRAA